MKEKLYLTILSLLSLILFIGMVAIEKQFQARAPEIYLEKPFVPANLIVNTDREYGPLLGVWQAFAQGGEEPGQQMLKPTIDLMKKTKPQYVRLDHIFDDDYYHVVIGRNNDGSLNLDWSRLDKTIDDILLMGAKPFLSLSYMPGMIAGSKINVPNWNDWQDLVRQTVKHYSDNMADVYYEVWNEPSLPMFGDWKMYGAKDYRQLYYYAVLGASQANSNYNYKIGGPAIPELDPVWIRLLFDYCLTNNLRLDFISWHRYSFDPAVFIDDVYQINILIDDPQYQSFVSIEKIITEWGPNSYKDSVYSSPVAAAHMLAVTRKLLDKVGWVFTFEIKDGPGQGSSGWGLLTHESVGIKEKPRFFLYDWLADFDGQRLEVLGEGSQITGLAVKKDRTVKAVLTNYSPYTPYEESFQFTFANLAGGKYRLLIQELFDQVKEQEIEAQDSLVLNLTMPAYSVVRLELTKISGLENQNSDSALGDIYFDAHKDRF